MNKCICVNVNLLNLGVFYYIEVSAIVLALSAQAALLNRWSSICRYAGGVQCKHVPQHFPAFDSNVL